MLVLLWILVKVLICVRIHYLLILNVTSQSVLTSRTFTHCPIIGIEIASKVTHSGLRNLLSDCTDWHASLWLSTLAVCQSI